MRDFMEFLTADLSLKLRGRVAKTGDGHTGFCYRLSVTSFIY
ncbi:hypothetical protein EMIT0P2_70158 [Pseudomonas sp. IT-P2]